ncbi:hypothetical protein MLD38_036563 [Melastoma candidum]|uniref:Uncharacterized protein n=1 Tax=Melastoma candidum TaxID=119954 RepID=A0ACB9LJF1_9MYRT|nr:hypothetical protein MLD38_036563 [Melastoma candidum]
MATAASLLTTPTISTSISSPSRRIPEPALQLPTRAVTGGAIRPATLLGLGAAGLALATADPARAAAAALLLDGEPSNALSLPTWTVHVSSVVEWITAMGLVWQYGEVSGNESWKGLSWGMVPLLGGAFCACVWHFFYNSESLEVLVAIQAALTVLGNATMCLAAFRIYRSSEERSKNM